MCRLPTRSVPTMVKSPHEAHHRVFQEVPELFTRALDILGLPGLESATAKTFNCDLTEIHPLERRVDTLQELTAPDGSRHLLIVEAQTGKDRAKENSWLNYFGHLVDKYPDHRCMLLVLARDAATARWAAGPFRYGHRHKSNVQLAPFVLGPENVPIVKEIEQAVADPPLALFSVLTHSSHPDIGGILDALSAALVKTADDDTFTRYADLAASGLTGSPAAAEHWRNLVGQRLFELRGFVAESLREQGAEQGLEQGLEQGRKESLRHVLDARGIALSDTHHALIQQTQDTDLLQTWLTRAIGATTADEVFTPHNAAEASAAQA